jgi:hypothetical protein
MNEIMRYKDGRKKNVQDIMPDDIPDGMMCLKWKRGLYYRPKNSGYTDNLLYAGFYTREDAIKYCFYGDEQGVTKNGSCGVYAMPLWMAIRQNYYSHEKIKEIRERLNQLEPHVEEDTYDTIIF